MIDISKKYLTPCLITLSLMGVLLAQEPGEDVPRYIDFERFDAISAEAREHRSERRITIEEFNAMSKDENTVILDSRSADAFAQIHVQNAININFSDFTEEKLKVVIPNKETRILIYCNNNFESDKSALRPKAPGLALNIPTFINLYGYGYQNVYELRDTLKESDPRVRFEGTKAKR